MKLGKIHRILVTNCICFVVLLPWEVIAGDIVHKVCQLLVPQIIYDYQIDTQHNIH